MTLKRAPNIVLLSLTGIYLLTSIFSFELFENALTVLAVAGLVLCCFYVRGSTGVISYALLVMAFVTLIIFHAPYLVWIAALKKNVSLITLYMLAPFLSLPLKYGGYIPAFNDLSRKYIYNKNRLYIVTSLLTYLLAIIASIGAQHIVYTLVGSMTKQTKVIASAMTRGYICAMCWAPSMIPMIVVMNYTGASWNSLFPGAFFIAGCLWLLGFLVEIATGKGSWQAYEKDNKLYFQESNCFQRKSIEFALVILLFISAIYFTHHYLGIDIFATVAMIAVLFSFLWSVVLRDIPQFISESKNYIGQVFFRGKNEILLFWVVGFFGVALDYAGLGRIIAGFLQGISGGNTVIVLISVIVLIFLPGLVGVHPMIPVVAIAGSVNPVELGFSKELFSLVLLSGWVIGSVTAPLSNNNISAAGLLGVKTFDISLRWNMLYGIVSIFVTVIILIVFREMGL